jgi:sirohydrochlorin ferrochelatase
MALPEARRQRVEPAAHGAVVHVAADRHADAADECRGDVERRRHIRTVAAGNGASMPARNGTSNGVALSTRAACRTCSF